MSCTNNTFVIVKSKNYFYIYLRDKPFDIMMFMKNVFFKNI